MKIPGLIVRVDKKKVIKIVFREETEGKKRISDAGHIFMHKRKNFPVEC